MAAPASKHTDSFRWLPNASARRVGVAALLLACAATIAIEIWRPVSDDPHSDRPGVLDFVGSYALYGFLGCVVLVALGRALRRVVMRPEHYWRDQS